MFYFCLLKPYKTRLIPFLLVRIISCLDCIDFSQVKHFLFRGCGFKSSQSFLPLTFEYSIVFLLINNVVVKRSTDFNRLAEDFWKGVISFSSVQFSSVQLLSHVWLFATPWTAACQASLSITNSWNLLKLMSIESVMPSNHLISVIPVSSCLQSFPASGSFPISQYFASGG